MSPAQVEQRSQQEPGVTLRSIVHFGVEVFRGLGELANPETYWNPDQTIHHDRDTVMGEINHLLSRDALIDTPRIEERQTVTHNPTSLYCFSQGLPKKPPQEFVSAVEAQGGSRSDAELVWELHPKRQRAGIMTQIYPCPFKPPKGAPEVFVDAVVAQGVEQGLPEKEARRSASKRWRLMEDEEKLAIIQQIG